MSTSSTSSGGGAKDIHKMGYAESVSDVREGTYTDVAAETGPRWRRRSAWHAAWTRTVKFLQVQDPGPLTLKQMFLYNPDLKPVEAERRTWRWWNFVNFWIADALNVNSLQIASTGVTSGLTWWQTWLSVWLGYAIVGVFIVSTARIGAYYHVGFPVAARASFGPFGSIWPVINRVVMAIIWFSTQTWVLGQCVQVMLRAVFGKDLPQRLNHPLSGTTTFQFLGFFLGWLFQLPFLWLPPHKVRHLFTVKAVLVPFAGIGYLAWVLAKAQGLGEVMHAPSKLSSHDLGWAFVSSVMNNVANFAAVTLNAPDFSRFSTTPKAPFWSQLISIPIAFALTTLIGILTAAASGKMFNSEPLWSPLDILNKMLDPYSSGDRAGAFFIAAGFGLAQIGTNIAANSLACGMDTSALLPRFMNIRRGSYFCAALALCLVPWNFYGSAANFTTYLSAYSVFLSSIAGVIVCDYYWLRRGYISLDDLYSAERGAAYTYCRLGLNWRAYAAYLLGLVPNMPGFVGTAGPHVPEGAIYLYKLNYFVGFIVSFILYALFSFLWPYRPATPATPEAAAERPPFQKGWYEEYADVETFADRYFSQPLRRRKEFESPSEMFV